MSSKMRLQLYNAKLPLAMVANKQQFSPAKMQQNYIILVAAISPYATPCMWGERAARVTSGAQICMRMWVFENERFRIRLRMATEYEMKTFDCQVDPEVNHFRGPYALQSIRKMARHITRHFRWGVKIQIWLQCGRKWITKLQSRQRPNGSGKRHLWTDPKNRP